MILPIRGDAKLDDKGKGRCSYPFLGSRWVLGVTLVLALMKSGAYSTLLFAATSDQVTSQQSKKPGEPGSESTTFPTTLSKLDGWHGMKIVMTSGYCSLEFPKRFGLYDKEEKRLLLSLTRHEDKIKMDIGCSHDSAYKQLFRLATEYQDAEAARWFVMPEGFSGLNLDGEWAETYVFEYRPMVLMKFKDLHRIVPKNEETGLARDVCNTAMTAPEAFLDGAGIKPVIRSLRQNGMNSLADKIDKECGRR